MCPKDCPICYEPLFTKTDKRIMRLKRKVLVKRGEKLPIIKLKCGHCFHKKCIKSWFMKTDMDSSKQCPMCRENIRFKPDSQDFMMNKLRYKDPNYEYGDEYLDTYSEYSEEDDMFSQYSDDSNGRELVDYSDVYELY